MSIPLPVQSADVSEPIAIAAALSITIPSLTLVWILWRSSAARRMLTWIAAEWIDPERWDDPDRWDKLRKRIAQSLSPHSPVTAEEPCPADPSAPDGSGPAIPRDATARPHDGALNFADPHLDDATEAPFSPPASMTRHQPDAGSKAYCVTRYPKDVTGETGTIVKRAVNANGNRLLNKEAKLVTRFHRAAEARCPLDNQPRRQQFPRLCGSSWIEGHRELRFEDFSATQFTAEEIRNEYPEGLSGRHVAWMFNRMLETLGFVHRLGTIHGAVLPRHLVFDCVTHGLMLTDWTHAKRPGSPINYRPRRDELWYPESIDLIADPGLDIYMAARCAFYLSGIDPQPDGARQPDKQLPAGIARFLRSCLMESRNMRPRDAWQLRGEFGDVLKREYGAPSFQHLRMARGENRLSSHTERAPLVAATHVRRG